jgi:Cdc6-like AAA superfamily ATPase
MRKDNPFSLMYGKPPYSIIERREQVENIIDTFNSNMPSTYAYMISGVRGSGKTVLLRNVVNKLKESDDWIIIDANPQGEIISSIAEKLYYEGKKHKLFLDVDLKVNLKFIELTISKKNVLNNPELIFEDLLKKANQNKKKVLISIDEVNNTKEIRLFANFYQSLIGNDYDVFLLMTGLPHNVNSLISADAASFLSRTPKIMLEPLNLVDISFEYKRLLNVTEETSIKMAKLSNGYAFAYQVLGYLFYEYEKKDLDEEIILKFDSYLRNNGYDVIWRELTNKEKKICEIMSQMDEIETSSILKNAKMSLSNYQNYRTSLIEKGIIISNGYGKVQFVLPRFKEFVLNIVKFNEF